MLHHVHEAQHVHHDQVGNHIKDRHLRNDKQQRSEDAAPNQDHGDVATPLAATLRDHERGEHHHEMHYEVVSGNVEPFKSAHDFQDQRVSLEKTVVLEPNDVVVIDVVAKMLVSHVLVRAVGRTAQPAHRTTEGRIVTAAFEHEVMSALVNQVRGDGHRVCQQQGRHSVHQPRAVKQPRKARDITGDRVKQRTTVHEQAFRFFKQRNDRRHGPLTSTDSICSVVHLAVSYC